MSYTLTTQTILPIFTKNILNNTLTSFGLSLPKVGLFTLGALLLASCSQIPQQVQHNLTLTAPVAGTENITFAQNQQALADVDALDLHGQVGIINLEKRYSTTFKYQQQASGSYKVSLDIPYSTKQVSVLKIGNSYLYVEDNKTYSSTSLEKFSEALFGFYVPLDILKDIILAKPIVPMDDPSLILQQNVVKSQAYNKTTLINYDDFKLVDHKFIVPYVINITHATDRIKIKLLDPYTYYISKTSLLK